RSLRYRGLGEPRSPASIVSRQHITQHGGIKRGLSCENFSWNRARGRWRLRQVASDEVRVAGRQVELLVWKQLVTAPNPVDWVRIQDLDDKQGVRVSEVPNAQLLLVLVVGDVVVPLDGRENQVLLRRE